jgi:cytochrome oxidase Cu insertion factor (SCO1/SenC/PrrC family)
MSARALAGGLVLLLLAAAAVDAAAPAAELLRGLRVIPLAAAPPPLSLPRLEDGRTVTLEQLRGRPVLVYFWASW